MTSLKKLSVLGSGGLRGLPAGIGNVTCLQSLDQFWVAANHDGSYSSSSSSSNIWVLRDLNHLCGTLKISNLGMVTSGEEAASARLQDKDSLFYLVLEWSNDGQGVNEKTSEDVLEALRPCATLPELGIFNYPGRTVPTWLGLGNSTTVMSSGLQFLGIDSWDGCTNLPALGNLPELRRLEIECMPKVRRVGVEWFGSKHGFPKLEYLRIRGMVEWEEWDSLDEKLFFTFPCLSQLEIWHCPKLRSLPPIFSTLLREIKVYDCPNLSNWIGILPPSIVTLLYISVEWANEMPSLPNLEYLGISGDDGTVSELSNHMVKFGTLKALEIRNCSNLESLPQEMALLKQLQKLEIHNCGKLLSLPSLPNLEDLMISGNDGVSELSNHLVKLDTLKRLEIRNCPNLESLPQEMASLKQLQILTIYECPKLKESCNKEGAEWYKIQHIPYIEIDWEDVRRNA